MGINFNHNEFCVLQKEFNDLLTKLQDKMQEVSFFSIFEKKTLLMTTVETRTTALRNK